MHLLTVEQKAPYSFTDRIYFRIKHHGPQTTYSLNGAVQLLDSDFNLKIDIKRCGCQGMCFAEPLVEVKTPGIPAVIYGRVNKEVAIKILEKHVCSNMLVKDHIYELRTRG